MYRGYLCIFFNKKIIINACRMYPTLLTITVCFPRVVPLSSCIIMPLFLLLHLIQPRQSSAFSIGNILFFYNNNTQNSVCVALKRVPLYALRGMLKHNWNTTNFFDNPYLNGTRMCCAPCTTHRTCMKENKTKSQYESL